MASLPAVCVYCRTRPMEAQWRPFCSERCKLLDLARWADGSYAIAGGTLDEPDEPARTVDPEHDPDAS